MKAFTYEIDGQKYTTKLPETAVELETRIIGEEVMEIVKSGKYDDQLPEILLTALGKNKKKVAVVDEAVAEAAEKGELKEVDQVPEGADVVDEAVVHQKHKGHKKK